jgi:hypothetical protein
MRHPSHTEVLGEASANAAVDGLGHRPYGCFTLLSSSTSSRRSASRRLAS